MEFKLNAEADKVAELLDQSASARRLAWGIVLAILLSVAVWQLAPIPQAVSVLVKK